MRRAAVAGHDQRRRRVDAQPPGLGLGAIETALGERAVRLRERPVGVDAGGGRDAAQEIVGHVAGVLLTLVGVEHLEEGPQPALPLGARRDLRGDGGIRAEEVQRAGLQLDLAAADVVVDDRGERGRGHAGAERALEVDELGEGEWRAGIAEHAVALRDAAEERGGISAAGVRRGVGGSAGRRHGDGDDDGGGGDGGDAAELPDPAAAGGGGHRKAPLTLVRWAPGAARRCEAAQRSVRGGARPAAAVASGGAR